jgi:hypothetical protein
MSMDVHLRAFWLGDYEQAVAPNATKIGTLSDMASAFALAQRDFAHSVGNRPRVFSLACLPPPGWVRSPRRAESNRSGRCTMSVFGRIPFDAGPTGLMVVLG